MQCNTSIAALVREGAAVERLWLSSGGQPVVAMSSGYCYAYHHVRMCAYLLRACPLATATPTIMCLRPCTLAILPNTSTPVATPRPTRTRAHAEICDMCTHLRTHAHTHMHTCTHTHTRMRAHTHDLAGDEGDDADS